ncbi:hypothetical protein N7490_007401 [Penicillium lividum]|nr:hypothetical protein N7490_007401 [Penicillium lividum]
MATRELLPTSPPAFHEEISPADISYPRWFGGSASCMAVLLSHPFDLSSNANGIKWRQRGVHSNGAPYYSKRGNERVVPWSKQTAKYITYGTSRIALYEEMKLSAKRSDRPLTIPSLAIMAAASGFTGAIFGTPSDIANVRMQNDRSLPVQNRRNYKNVFDAWIKMKRHEGWRSFTQGLWPNCFRSGIMTASQLASYDAFKRLLQSVANTNEERPLIHFFASVLASLVATSISSPMDVIRTQLMSSSDKSSVLNIVRHLTQEEGFRWVFRGWTPSFIRLGPQTIATLVMLEQHKRVYRLIKTGRD